MTLALQRALTPASGHPEWTVPDHVEAGMSVEVVFTTVEATLSALKKAGELASRLGARIVVVAPQVVPYPLPLESPPVLVDWNERRFRLIAGKSRVETSVHLYLCRDRLATLLDVLSPRSVVVIGGHKRWWPTSEQRLARKLQSAGHEVIFEETE